MLMLISDGHVSLFLQRLGDPVLRPFLQVNFLHLLKELYTIKLVVVIGKKG